jgi:Zn-dependent peptidase ImmA (M78 family)
LGSSVPSLSELKRLATGYRRQLAALLLPQPPLDDEPQLPDFRRRTDYNPPRLSPGLHVAIRASRLRQRALKMVASDSGLDQFPIGSVGIAQDPEEAAEWWRHRFGLTVAMQSAWQDGYEALRVLRDLTEGAGVTVMQLSFGDDGVRGFSISDVLAPLIALNSSDAVSGRLFTLFHEFAHLLLGDAGLCEPTGAMRYPELSLPVERFCNRFAGALLVPLEALERMDEAKSIANLQRLPSDSDLAQLRSRFKVSSQVLWYRIHDAGLISDESYRALWAVWANREPPPPSTGGPAMDRPERSLNTNGRRFVSMIMEAEDRGLISFADALDYLRVKERELPKLIELASAAP